MTRFWCTLKNLDPFVVCNFEEGMCERRIMYMVTFVSLSNYIVHIIWQTNNTECGYMWWFSINNLQKVCTYFVLDRMAFQTQDNNCPTLGEILFVETIFTCITRCPKQLAQHRMQPTLLYSKIIPCYRIL